MKIIDATRFFRLNYLVKTLNETCSAEDDAVAQQTFLQCLREYYGVDAFMEVDTTTTPFGQYQISRISVIEENGLPRFINNLPPNAITRGLLATLIKSPGMKLITQLECKNDSAVGEFFCRYNSLLAIPLAQEQQSKRWLIFLSHSNVGFTQSNIEQIALLGVVAQSRHEVHELHRRIEGIQQEIQGQVRRLTTVQKAILQTELPTMPGFEADIIYRPRRVVGGDWYGVMPFSSGNNSTATSIGIAIGDVCGHDAAATVVMAMVLAILRCFPQQPDSPSDIMRHLNNHLYKMDLPDSYTTAFLGLLSLETLKLKYCIAGHPRPLIRHPDGTVLLMDQSSGYPLGMLEDSQYRDAEVTLIPGSTLCLYTDGITDTLSSGGDFYGLEALKNIFSSGNDAPQVVVKDIIAEIDRHQGQAPPHDDSTLLVIKVGNSAL